ncbi:MAG: helix-turn-helix transcriptional regulator [Pseudomonadota bacterium]
MRDSTASARSFDRYAPGQAQTGYGTGVPNWRNLWVQTVAASLNATTRPRFILDANCTLIVSNGAGEVFLESPSLLELNGGRVRPVARRSRDEFRAAVQLACRAGEPQETNLVLTRPFEHIPVLVRVGVLGAAATPEPFGSGQLDEGLAWMDIADVHAPINLDGNVIRRLFGLTRREIDLAMLLAQGYSLAESAERLGVTIETARSHLKNVFAKTHVKGQAQLMRVLVLTAR